jgi:citrate synthase
MVVLEGEEFLAVDEAARLLGVKPATLYAYVSRGLLRSYRQGIKRQRLYRRSEVEGLVRLAPSSAAESSSPSGGELAEGRPRMAGGGRRRRRRSIEIPLAESWIRD